MLELSELIQVIIIIRITIQIIILIIILVIILLIIILMLIIVIKYAFSRAIIVCGTDQVIIRLHRVGST